MLDPWEFFSGRDTDYAVEITASNDQSSFRFYFDLSAGEGALIRNHPAAMFSDTSIYWIERFRHNNITTQTLHFHDGASSVGQRNFIPSLLFSGAIYVINVTDGEYFAIRPTDSIDGVNYSYPSSIGGSFLNYTLTEVNDNFVHRHPDNLDADAWLDGIRNKRLILAFSTQNEYRPYA